ncbi:hypothetical protein CONPUDRAFT_57225 [Coniophora puteana RWD-64-598 SS2]|uniref:DUF7330 domain-containing protein n=1 Tax=Coniophora puteana (strain RWD-64-598) TaxID=741705 RepID=A0A5M3MN75_CONPW|nr:uncharacterized protein CONPUDRAFT_57225 [Coniophora puteana RWD-64-598 SS2]EIW80553.1 hypothetical protein CONPUDRAFT_57225 [Coniophora puteana RWD-64-598 SS2]
MSYPVHVVIRLTCSQPRIDRGNTGYPLTKDGKIHQCFGSNGTNWEGYLNPGANSDYPWAAEASFEVPIDSEALYLFTRGSRQHGSVRITTEDNHLDNVRILVHALYYRQGSIAGTHACLLEPTTHEKSIGIFTPEWGSRSRSKDHIQFDITIVIPTRRYGSERRVRKLDVNTPRYDLILGTLQEKVFFDIISLSTENSLVDVKSVACATGKFESENGKIQGTFSSLKSLSLHTSNSPIEATVHLANQAVHQRTSTLDMSTTSDRIDAKVDLYTPDFKSTSSLRYSVTAMTDNSPLSVSVTNLPVDAQLTLSARTLNADAQVNLPPAFEGAFDVRTSGHNAAHLVEDDVSDPAKAGRKRTVHYDTHDNARSSGTIAWSPEHERLGRVEVGTSNAGATLRHGAGI